MRSITIEVDSGRKLVALTAQREMLTPEEALQVARDLESAAREVKPYVGSKYIEGDEVVSKPGAAIEVRRIILTEEGRKGLQVGGPLHE